MTFSRLPAFFKTTTFRLALIHAALFTLFSAALLFYVYNTTAVQLERDGEEELVVELQALSEAHTRGGFEALNQATIERSSSSTFYYLLTQENGEKVSGDFNELPGPPPAQGQADIAFSYDARTVEGDTYRKNARGRMIRFPDGPVLMVAYDLGPREDTIRTVTDTIWRSAFVGLALSLLGGVLVSRSASRRVESLSRTTEKVMAGELSERAAVLESGDEFDRLAVSLNAMLARLERLIQASRHAGDAIAHDLRSPLARLRNYLETIHRDSDQVKDWDSVVAGSIEQVDAVLETCNAILRLSHVQGGHTGKMDRVDASELMQELAELYDPVCEDANLKFSSDIRPNLFIRADKSLIANAVTNLLANAVKYTPKGGEIQLLARRRQGEVELAVIDNGAGIPETDRERVIQRFVRLESARTEPGSGLGLALVSAVAEMHQGRFELNDGLAGENGPGLRASLFVRTG